MKRISIVLLVIAALLMVSCTQAAPPPGNGESSADTQAPGTSPASDPSSNPVTIVFWDMQGGNADYPVAAEEFAKKITGDHPNITIEYQSIPWAGATEVFASAIAAGQGPDFSNGFGFQSFQYYLMGELLSLEPVIENWRASGVLDNYDPALIDYFQIDGVQIGVPTGLEPRLFLYRKDWFDAAGIPAPQTWDDMYQAAQHFTDPANGVFGLVYPAEGGDGNVLFYSWFASNNGGIWTADGSTTNWVSPENIETVEFIRKMRDEGLMPEGMSAYTNAEVIPLLSQDKAAMAIITSGNAAKQVADTNDGYGKWALLPAPAGPSANGTNGSIAAMNAYMAYSATNHPEETLAALQWWNENFITLMSDPGLGVGSVPPRIDWQTSSSYVDSVSDPFLRDMLVSGEILNSRLLISPAKNVSNWLVMSAINGEQWGRRLSQAILTTNTPAESLLGEYQTESEALMRELAY